ncbi:hypothetical protein PIB30_073248, partial [Stylosanthes scabra]|nr:hypothetical protein [Stylosanthes scabra]
PPAQMINQQKLDQTTIQSTTLPSVVGELVVAANHAEGDDVVAIIEKVKVLPADGDGEAGNHAKGSQSGAVA